MASDLCPPWNFSWVVPDRLAAMAWPQTEGNLHYILHQGVKQLVTLSPEMQPPVRAVPGLKWTLIAVTEFEAPTIEQINEFIHICEEAEESREAVGVHCRMGRGRTGVMAACYLVRFLGQHPEQAITTLRRTRPGSVETYLQERIVITYHDLLRGTKL